MTQAQLAKAVGPEVVAALMALVNGNANKPAGKRSKADMLAAKDRAIKATFTKRGIKDVVLMDRTNKDAEFNVRPYNGWLAQGRRVRKGQKAVRGLFHISQTDVVEAGNGEAAE